MNTITYDILFLSIIKQREYPLSYKFNRYNRNFDHPLYIIKYNRKELDDSLRGNV